MPSPSRFIFRKIYGAIGRRDTAEALRLSRRLTPWLCWIMRSRRRRNIQNLFPGIDAVRLRDLERRHLEYHSMLQVHIAKAQHYTTEELRRLIVWEGDELLAEYLAEGRGIIVVGGHNGTWWFCPGAMAVRGHKVSVVVNRDLFPPMREYLDEIVRGSGIRIIHTGKGALTEIREVLGRGEILYLNVDLSVRHERSTLIPFLGAGLPMDAAPALLALRQKSLLLWSSCWHDSDGRPKVRLKKDPPCGRDTELGNRSAILNHWARRLEDDVREFPHQWWPLSFVALEAGQERSLITTLPEGS